MKSGLEQAEAHVAVRFVSQLISATRDKAGTCSGDPEQGSDRRISDAVRARRLGPKGVRSPIGRSIAAQAPA